MMTDFGAELRAILPERVNPVRFQCSIAEWLGRLAGSRPLILADQHGDLARIGPLPRFLKADAPTVTIDGLHRSGSGWRDRVAAGEPHVLTRHGRPVCLLVPVLP